LISDFTKFLYYNSNHRIYFNCAKVSFQRKKFITNDFEFEFKNFTYNILFFWLGLSIIFQLDFELND